MSTSVSKKDPKIFIIYDAVLSLDGENLTIGGTQAYLMALAEVLARAGWDVCIVQDAIYDFDKNVHGINFHGRKVSVIFQRNKYKALVKRLHSKINPTVDVIIWGTYNRAVKLKCCKTLSIQHGIGFDMIPNSPRNELAKSLKLGKVVKFFQRYSALRSFAQSEYNVCVDYNFVNWYRTFSQREDDHKIHVIPNFTDIPQYPIKEKRQFRRVLFARRFIEWRGVLLMVEAARKLLNKYDDICFTFAGEGKLSVEIEQLCRSFPDRVELTKYSPNESLEFHSRFDISVVPTIGSEGTSLSLLEAMASGCAVICSNVGGMTNIVLDQHNGLMINPNQEELMEAIERLYLDPGLANRLAFCAHQCVVDSFSKQLWSARWMKVIEEVTSPR